jgi:hypothetical protein
MTADTNNLNIIVGSVDKVLDMRLILGDEVSAETIVLFNTINKSLTYCINQYNAGNSEYSTKIKTLEDLLIKLKYSCPSICNYYKAFNTSFDFKASNATIKIDTVNYKISQLQITI